jgi:hypothetical protein
MLQGAASDSIIYSDRLTQWGGRGSLLSHGHYYLPSRRHEEGERADLSRIIMAMLAPPSPLARRQVVSLFSICRRSSLKPGPL